MSHLNNDGLFEQLEAALNPLTAHMLAQPNPDCSCQKCNPNAWWMIVCSECGNKRCPHATDHKYKCTNSNEPGQPGSRFQ